MFILSKLFAYLLNPAAWVLVCLLIAWKTQRPFKRKRWLSIGLIIFLFFSNPFILQRLIQTYQWPPAPFKANEQYDAGVLLGGLMNYDDAAKEAYFNGASDRFIQTLKLYKEGHIRKIIVSGGKGTLRDSPFREADYLVKNFQSMGVPGEDILIDRESRNTVENARYSHRITDSIQSGKSIVLITSALHMPRSVKIFEREGIKVRPFPADYITSPVNRTPSLTDFIPSATIMGQWSMLIKEWIGILSINLQRGR
jgi:uncharacterized SAM-binding protein YcdF (DUF218 family)